MDDLVKSFKAYLYDRVSSPLLSSFAISWVLWNHRLFVVLLTSDLKVKEKFAYADNVLYPTIHEVGLRGFLWPLFSALFILLIYPIPSRWIFQYVHNEQKKLKAVQQRIEDETPVTQEEARSLKASVREAARTLDKEITERDTTIKALNAEIDTLREEVAKLQLQIVEPTPASTAPDDNADEIESPPRKQKGDYSRTPLASSEQLVLRLIAEGDGIKEPILKAMLHTQHNFTTLQTKYYLDQLLKKNLIKADHAVPDGPKYTGTADGRANLMTVRVTVDS